MKTIWILKFKISLNNYLPYNIPTNNDSVKTDWFMVLDVKDIGMVKTGVKASSASLFDAISGVLETALSKKTWFAKNSIQRNQRRPS